MFRPIWPLSGVETVVMRYFLVTCVTVRVCSSYAHDQNVIATDVMRVLCPFDGEAPGRQQRCCAVHIIIIIIIVIIIIIIIISKFAIED
jgi:hypothetical protein